MTEAIIANLITNKGTIFTVPDGAKKITKSTACMIDFEPVMRKEFLAAAREV